MLRSTFSACILLLSLISSAQEFSGLVVNQDTGEPVAFAGFTTQEGLPITVSNRNGEFRLCTAQRQLQVSAPGFEHQDLDLSVWPQGRRKVIELNETPEAEPVDFEKTSGKYLMQRVFEKAMEVYQPEAVTLNGFFREVHWLPESGQLLMRQEAEVTSDFPKLKKLVPSQRAMSEKYSEYQNPEPDKIAGHTTLNRGLEFRNDSLLAKVQGPVRSVPGLPLGTYLCNDLDVIRNPIYFLGQQDLNQYTFHWERTVSYFGEPVAVVKFSPMEASSSGWFEGVLYMDLVSGAIIRAHYQNTSFAVEEFNYTQALPSKVMLDRTYDVGYTLWNGKWQLQFASVTTNSLELKNVQKVRTYSDFVVNGIFPAGSQATDLPKEEKYEVVSDGSFTWRCNSFPPLETLKAETKETSDPESDLVIHYPSVSYLHPALVAPRKQFELNPYYYELNMSPLSSPVYVDAPEQPVVAILEAGNQEIPVYLERGQRTVITITTDTKRNVEFNIYEQKGRNNTVLIRFESLKNKLLASLKDAWKTGSPDESFRMTRILQAGLHDFLRREQEKDSLSAPLRSWMEMEATYYPAAWLLTYQLLTNPYAPLPAEWQEWLKDADVNNQQAAFQTSYQHFVLLTLKHKALQRKLAEDNLYPVEEQLNLAIEMLRDSALENVALLLLQNSLRCASPDYELNIGRLTELFKETPAAYRINKIRSAYRSYGFLTGIPLLDITTGEAVHDYSENKYFGRNQWMVFWNCNCGNCKDCGLHKELFKQSLSFRNNQPKFIAPVWLDELCEDKFDECSRSSDEAVILSVYFQYLPAFMAKMPFVEMPHAVLLNNWGRVQELSFHPDSMDR